MPPMPGPAAAGFFFSGRSAIATSVVRSIAAADAAYAGTSASAILASASLLDAYNNSGDTITIGPAGKATPKTSQSLANKGFWDAP